MLILDMLLFLIFREDQADVLLYLTMARAMSKSNNWKAWLWRRLKRNFTWLGSDNEVNFHDISFLLKPLKMLINY